MAVIRVTGHICSGKSSLCKELANALGYEYHYTGGIMRQMAAEMNLSMEDFYKWLENKNKTIEEIMLMVKERTAMERKRYYELYDLENHLDENDPIFKLVIDTTYMTEAEV